MPAEMDVVAYLESKGYTGRKAAGPEMVYPCFFDCEEPASSRKRKLYVNTDTGMYYCQVCNVEGGTTLLQRHFGDDPRVKHLPGEDPFVRRQVLNEATKVGESYLVNNDDVMLYLVSTGDTPLGPGRGLHPETIVERRLGCVVGGWSLTGDLRGRFRKEDIRTSGLVYRDGHKADDDFFYDHILIPYCTRGSVAQVRGRATDRLATAKYVNGPGTEHLLYNADDLDGAEDVVITEGEFDCMVLKQTLLQSPEDRVRKIAVVGIAGTGAIPKNIESLLDGAKRVYIGFDSDNAGKKAAIKLKERLGTKSRILELPGGDGKDKVDWTEFIVRMGNGWRECMALIGTASGKRIFSMREAGLAYRNQRASTGGIKTGFSAVDVTLEPGLLPGQVTIVLAKTGTGKTIFCCNLAYEMRKHPQLIISLEMTREEVYDRLRRIYLFHHPTATDEVLEHELHNIAICDENRLSDTDFATLIEEYEVEMGRRPEVVFVDYLGYFARGQRGNSAYEKTTNAVMQLKAVAKSDDPSKRFHIIAPHQVNRLAKEGKPIDMDDARDSGVVEETADFLFSIYRPEEAMLADPNAEPSGSLRLALLKSRHGGKGKVFSLTMDLLCLSIVDQDSPKARKAKEHNYLHARGSTWEDIRRAETMPQQRKLQVV